jgi:hypothetical protein
MLCFLLILVEVDAFGEGPEPDQLRFKDYVVYF